MKGTDWLEPKHHITTYNSSYSDTKKALVPVRNTITQTHIGPLAGLPVAAVVTLMSVSAAVAVVFQASVPSWSHKDSPAVCPEHSRSVGPDWRHSSEPMSTSCSCSADWRHTHFSLHTNQADLISRARAEQAGQGWASRA